MSEFKCYREQPSSYHEAAAIRAASNHISLKKSHSREVAHQIVRVSKLIFFFIIHY